MRRDLDTADLQRYAEEGIPGYCPVCGSPLEWNPFSGRYGQWAHYICNTKTHRKMFGAQIIDSRWNGVMVCGLRCNNAVQLKYGNQPKRCHEMAAWIMEKEEEDGT